VPLSHANLNRVAIGISDIRAVEAICAAATPAVDFADIGFCWNDVNGCWCALDLSNANALVATQDPDDWWVGA
jgi:hypothetical protein